VFHDKIATIKRETIVRHLSAFNFLDFRFLDFSIERNNILKSIWIAMVRNICTLRNNIIFNKHIPDNQHIFMIVQIKKWHG